MRKHTNACDFDLPSDTFFKKYALAATFPDRDICDSAIR
jgi:hypothetical protein